MRLESPGGGNLNSVPREIRRLLIKTIKMLIAASPQHTILDMACVQSFDRAMYSRPDLEFSLFGCWMDACRHYVIPYGRNPTWFGGSSAHVLVHVACLLTRLTSFSKFLFCCGNIHQGHECFSGQSRGKQCAFMSLSALLTARNIPVARVELDDHWHSLNTRRQNVFERFWAWSHPAGAIVVRKQLTNSC